MESRDGIAFYRKNKWIAVRFVRQSEYKPVSVSAPHRLHRYTMRGYPDDTFIGPPQVSQTGRFRLMNRTIGAVPAINAMNGRNSLKGTTRIRARPRRNAGDPTQEITATRLIVDALRPGTRIHCVPTLRMSTDDKHGLNPCAASVRIGNLSSHIGVSGRQVINSRIVYRGAQRLSARTDKFRGIL
jgi:hypothetical protein